MEAGKFEKYLNNETGLNNESLEEIKTLAREFPFFQTGWLLYLKNLKTTGHPEFEKELNKASIRVTDRKKLFYSLNPGEKQHYIQPREKNNLIHTGDYFSNEDIPGAPHSRTNDLIDNFITSSPTFKIKNSEGNNIPDNDFSKESITQNEEIINETLADILIRQKKYGEAIEAFEKLSLKNPEKNIYFAGRIEEIKKLKNI